MKSKIVKPTWLDVLRTLLILTLTPYIGWRLTSNGWEASFLQLVTGFCFYLLAALYWIVVWAYLVAHVLTVFWNRGQSNRETDKQP